MAIKQTDKEINKAIIGVKSGRHEDFDVIRLTYSPLIENMAQSFEKSGAGNQGDLYDEAVRALLKAVLTYDIDSEKVTFGLYAKICIRNALISVRRAKLTREKREARSAAAVKKNVGRRKDNVFSAMDADAIMEKMQSVLSPYEYRVLKEYITGVSVSSIAKLFEKSEKSVNNALYRIRRKAKSLVK